MIEFLTITAIILLATISPGPDFIMVTRNALRHTQKTGMMTALGIACGTLCHSVYCILGLAIIISRSLLVFTVIKYLGAAYLIYIGVKGLFEKKFEISNNSVEQTTCPSAFQAFRQGLFCTALNPKAILFFIAFFTMIIKPSMPMHIQASYALEIAMIDLIWYVSVSFLFAHPKVKTLLGQALHYVTKTFSGFLILFGLKIATLAK